MLSAAASRDRSAGPWPGWGLVALTVVGLDTLGLYAYLGQRLYLLSPVWIYLTGYLILFCFYAYASGRIVPRLAPQQTRTALILILAGAVLFRLVLLPSPPSLSTDIYRYVWDGRLITHGINPYRYTPDAESLYYLHDDIWRQMDYKTYLTIYMPVSQLVFAICSYVFHTSITGFKLVYTLFDIGNMALLIALLRRLGKPLTHIVWYAWCPVPITEVSIAGHQDVVGVFFLLLAFLLAIRPNTNRAWSAIALVAATLTKGFAIVLLPMFVRRFGKSYLMAAVPALVYLGLPMWVFLPSFLKGMNQYLVTVHVNGSIFHWSDIWFTHVTRYHFFVASWVSRLAIVAASAWAAWKPIVDDRDMLRRSLVVLMVTLLVVPTLFPWYLLWVLPFFCLLGRRPSWAFVVLVCAIAMLYTFYFSNRLYWWTTVVEYTPFYAILALEYIAYRTGTTPLSVLRSFARSVVALVRPREPVPGRPVSP